MESSQGAQLAQLLGLAWPWPQAPLAAPTAAQSAPWGAHAALGELPIVPISDLHPTYVPMPVACSPPAALAFAAAALATPASHATPPDFQLHRLFQLQQQLQPIAAPHQHQTVVRDTLGHRTKAAATRHRRKIPSPPHAASAPAGADIPVAPAEAERFVCTVPSCGKTFSSRPHLRRHLRIHAGIKSFVCTVPGCTARFVRGDNLKQHVVKIHASSQDAADGDGERTIGRKKRKKPHSAPFDAAAAAAAAVSFQAETDPLEDLFCGNFFGAADC
ncbi:hypothetical protein HDU84_000340 [Entophlyctis sp. JEL0112]|nr:hypothetical protein HDU84_000340 [Entophlyctis sp. JEL0112]